MDDLIRRSDAIRVASGYCHWINIPDELAKLPSVNPIPCEDAISRQAVLNYIYNDLELGDEENGADLERKMELENSYRYVKALPSVTPVSIVEKTGRWIPVSERLPEIHQDVLLSLRSLDIVVGFRAETEPYFYCYCADSCYIESQNVLAWMSLPQPYKPQESEDKE